MLRRAGRISGAAVPLIRLSAIEAVQPELKAVPMSFPGQANPSLSILASGSERGAREDRSPLRELPHAALGALLWRLFRAQTQQEREWLYPAGPPEVSVDGVDPVRILVIGDAPAAGCGVLIHDLGIAGFLARHLAEHLQRGVVVTVRAQPAASARWTLAQLDVTDLDGYDAIILMLATTDAFCLTPRRNWHSSMTGLVLALKASDAASVFVTGAASMHLTESLSPVARRITGNHARVLNIETSIVCAISGTPMISLDPVSDLTPGTYAKWGRRIGEHVVAALDRSRN
jgi:hypothetical protein